MRTVKKVGIVVPCFNEGQRLNIKKFKEFALNDISVVFAWINDGSTDNTAEILTCMANEIKGESWAIDRKVNKGKAETVRFGVQYLLKNSDVEAIGYWDADLSTPLSEIKRFVSFMEENEQTLFVMGTRIKRLGALIKRSEFRHYLSRSFATAASLILKLPVYDTQCGAKLIRRELAEIIFTEPFHSKWLFDIELLSRVIGHLGYTKTLSSVYELPLSTWIDGGGSKVKVKDIFKVPIELIAIKLKYRKFLKL